MDRRAKVVAIAERIEAADDLRKLKDERDAQERKEDAEDLKPDDYRKEHGRCPNGYEYDPFDDKCLPTEKAPDEAAEDEREEQEREEKEREREKEKKDKPADKKEEPAKEGEPEKFKWADTPEERKGQRKARREKLEKLFEQDPDGYDREVERMRASGEMPDEATSQLLAQVDKIESLPEEILNDKEKLTEIIEQQDAQREHEEMMVEKTEMMLKDFEKQRQRALDAGKRPPKLNPKKLLVEVERMYGRKLPKRSKKMDKVLEEEKDVFSEMVSDSGQNPGTAPYRWKKWFERMTAPLPTWTPGGRETSVWTSSVADVLDDVAVELERRGSAHIAAAVDLASESLSTATAVTAKTLTSPNVTDMEPRELGFPPYDQDRPVPKHVPNEPSGRLAFPPYDKVETVEYKERDARMQGFPPYDGKGEPHDTETIGLPPYNSKPPHMGRGFPPYRDGKNVYEQRQETVDYAVSP